MINKDYVCLRCGEKADFHEKGQYLPESMHCTNTHCENYNKLYAIIDSEFSSHYIPAKEVCTNNDLLMEEVRLLRSKLYNTLCVYENDISHKVWGKLDAIDDGLLEVLVVFDEAVEHKRQHNRQDEQLKKKIQRRNVKYLNIKR